MEAIAKAIMDLNYGELRDLAAELRDMCDGEIRQLPTKKEDFAELLFDWAESKGDAE